MFWKGQGMSKHVEMLQIIKKIIFILKKYYTLIKNIFMYVNLTN